MRDCTLLSQKTSAADTYLSAQLNNSFCFSDMDFGGIHETETPLFSSIPSLFPIISIILLVLSIRHIAKDEAVAMFSRAVRTNDTGKKGKKK